MTGPSLGGAGLKTVALRASISIFDHTERARPPRVRAVRRIASRFFWLCVERPGLCLSLGYRPFSVLSSCSQSARVPSETRAPLAPALLSFSPRTRDGLRLTLNAAQSPTKHARHCPQNTKTSTKGKTRRSSPHRAHSTSHVRTAPAVCSWVARVDSCDTCLGRWRGVHLHAGCGRATLQCHAVFLIAPAHSSPGSDGQSAAHRCGSYPRAHMYRFFFGSVQRNWWQCVL